MEARTMDYGYLSNLVHKDWMNTKLVCSHRVGDIRITLVDLEGELLQLYTGRDDFTRYQYEGPDYEYAEEFYNWIEEFLAFK